MSVNRWPYQIELFHLSAASFSSVEKKLKKQDTLPSTQLSFWSLREVILFPHK